MIQKGIASGPVYFVDAFQSVACLEFQNEESVEVSHGYL
jgi:hypothetical protein